MDAHEAGRRPLGVGELIVVRLAGSGLLVATAAIHLDLYLTGYRSIPTIGWLFLLQTIGALVLAIAVAGTAFFARAVSTTAGRLAAGAGALLAAGTLGGYLLSVWVGLFGFREVRTGAGVAAGVVEVAAFAVLASLALDPRTRTARSDVGGRPVRGSPSPRELLRRRALAVAAASLAAVLLGAGVASARGPSQANQRRVELTTRMIGGTAVLADAGGFTLYWFAPDTPGTSRCYGSCAAYWPPLTGSPAAGSGVTGRLGTIRRSGGALQATYDGHPLYTYVGDVKPGAAKGNGLNLNGGVWHEAAAHS